MSARVQCPRARNRRRLAWMVAGGLAVLALWQILACTMHSAIVASPIETVGALTRLARSGALWTQLWITLRRLLLSLAIGGGIGLAAGLVAGVVRQARAFLEPFRWVAMALPAVMIAVFGMMWFGMGGEQAVFLVAFIIAPIMYVNTVDGIRGLDPRLLEMAKTYRLPRGMLLTQIYLPGIALPVASGLTLAVGIGARGIILAELLGASDGVGHSFSRAWTFLQTPDLYAWVLCALALVAILEFGFLKPLRRRVRRWQKGGAV
jgi:NitT/TauT family transport system permease protein